MSGELLYLPTVCALPDRESEPTVVLSVDGVPVMGACALRHFVEAGVMRATQHLGIRRHLGTVRDARDRLDSESPRVRCICGWHRSARDVEQTKHCPACDAEFRSVS